MRWKAEETDFLGVNTDSFDFEVLSGIQTLVELDEGNFILVWSRGVGVLQPSRQEFTHPIGFIGVVEVGMVLADPRDEFEFVLLTLLADVVRTSDDYVG